MRRLGVFDVALLVLFGGDDQKKKVVNFLEEKSAPLEKSSQFNSNTNLYGAVRRERIRGANPGYIRLWSVCHI